jgi:hypothetical protein
MTDLDLRRSELVLPGQFAWPPPTLPTNKTNDTAQLDDHPAAHNAANQAINDLVQEAQNARAEVHQSFAHGGGNYALVAFDLGSTTMIPGGKPYALYVTAWVTFDFGYSGSPGSRGSFDLYAHGVPGIVKNTQQQLAENAATWYTASLCCTWTVAAGGDTGFKTRFHHDSGDNMWASAYGVWHVQRYQPV